MSYRNSLLSILLDKSDFVRKTYNEIFNHATSTTSDREIQKATFLLLVTESNKLLENEKKYCRERYIYDFEFDNAVYKWGVAKECNKCKLTRYSSKYCENCISLHLQKLFVTWTSGNDIVDKFIQKCQKLSSLPNYIMEWIPFHQFKNVKYLTKGGFGSIYTATWIKGSIDDYDENKKKFTYFGDQLVVLKLLDNSNDPGKKFFDEVSSNF